MPSSISIFLLLALGLVAYGAYTRINLYLRYRKFASKHGCLPIRSATRWDPFLGLDNVFRLGKAAAQRNFLKKLDEDMFGKYGNTFEINLMGQSQIFTNEPANVQALLVTKFPDFEIGQRRRDNSAQLLGVGLFNADGPVWEHSRAALRPNLTRKRASDLRFFEKHVRTWIGELSKEDEEPVDMQEWAFRFTLDIAMEFLFKKSSGVLEKPNLARYLAWAFEVGVKGVAQRSQLGKFAPLYYNSDYNRACKIVHGFIDPFVHEAIANAGSMKISEKADGGDGEYMFLDALVRDGLGFKEIRDHVLNILIAIRDTSACTLGAAFFELARNPNIQTKLRKEIHQQLNSHIPTCGEDIKNMTYLKWFMKETLRLYPPIAVNVRVANKDTFLPFGGGPDGTAPIFVRKGQEVVYHLFSMHRRRDLWGEDAGKFRPERWGVVAPAFQYMPFNAGPRVCPGQEFALLETSYAIVRFLQEYARIEALDLREEWTENLALTLTVGQGSWVKLGKLGDV